MVAAKLDQSRVLVTKFHCNRSSLKCRTSPVRNAPELRSLHTTAPPVQSEYPVECCAAAAVPLPQSSQGQTSKSISSVSFVRIESKFCLQYTGDTDSKNDGAEFWNSNSVIFENFWKFSKRRRAVPLRTIWAIMVAAKLDQSRVLVTLKGRSAGQGHTDRQTRLKIMALQVCNWAKNVLAIHARCTNSITAMLTFRYGWTTYASIASYDGWLVGAQIRLYQSGETGSFDQHVITDSDSYAWCHSKRQCRSRSRSYLR